MWIDAEHERNRTTEAQAAANGQQVHHRDPCRMVVGIAYVCSGYV